MGLWLLFRPCNFWFEDDLISLNRSVTSSLGRIVDIFERDKLWSANEATSQSRHGLDTLRSLSLPNESVLGSEGVVEHSIALICQIETSWQIAPASSRQRSSRDDGEANNDNEFDRSSETSVVAIVAKKAVANDHESTNSGDKTYNIHRLRGEFRPAGIGTEQRKLVESLAENADHKSLYFRQEDSQQVGRVLQELTSSAENIDHYDDVPDAPACPAIPEQCIDSSTENIDTDAGPQKRISLAESIERNDAERSERVDRKGGCDASNRIVVIQEAPLLGRENDQIGWTTVQQWQTPSIILVKSELSRVPRLTELRKREEVN